MVAPVCTLGYKDKDGKVVQIPFHGTDTRKVEMDAAFGRIQNRLIKIDTYLQEQHTVCTFVTCEEMRRQCKELAKSEEPLMMKEGKWVPITILEIDFQDIVPWTRPYPYKITFINTEEDAKSFEVDD